jgi:hypothetical protein
MILPCILKTFLESFSARPMTSDRSTKSMPFETNSYWDPTTLLRPNDVATEPVSS